ncbi:hypothetical protein [Bythopirellula goksoeyrii]|uniref:hypothetical protein n=1 Tax=Bythopirellula goksoeyrii TaxID=1400387 RepID=UPI0011CE9B42|nr:hypothetical protein [Bythopirellula goksoeyrii]
MPAIWFFSSIAVPAIMPFNLWDNLTILSAFANCYIVLAAFFLGMHIAGSENARCTTRFMQAVPTSMWRPGLAKLFVGCLVAVLPLVIFYTVICTILPLLIDNNTLDAAIERLIKEFGTIVDIYGWSLYNLAIGTFGVTSLLLWMSAAGVNRSDEVRAGAIGFLVCGSVWMVFGFLAVWVENHNSLLGNGWLYLIPALPGGPAIALGMSAYRNNQLITPLLTIIGITSHGTILYWYLKRFGRIAVPPKRARASELNFFRWTHKHTEPMRSQWRAIAWKQFRETGPLAAMAVFFVLLIVPIVYYFNSQYPSHSDFGEMLGGASLWAGFFVILVAGIGAYLEDLSPRVNNFWRSRPVNINLWFVVKYVVGLTVLALAFGSLLTPAYWLEIHPAADRIYWFIMAAFFATYSLALLYTISMASYCLLRQPIYAAVLTFGLLFGGIVLVRWLFYDTSQSILFFTTLFVALVSAITIAYLAVKHDWGWKEGR